MHGIHKHLHLQHHRHTGRKLHHKHTSYRSLALVLVAAGAFMIGLSAVNRAAVGAFSVGATVRAPVPTTPPIITSLSDGDTLSSDSQVVAGSCPIITPQAAITITIDGISAGSGVCDASNDFAIPIRLAAGTHTVVVQGVTITGDAGPASSPLRIIYKPTGSKTLGSIVSQANGAVNTPNPLVVTPEANVLYLGGDDVTWSGTINGGTPPYKVFVDWGDGARQTFDQPAGPTSFDHAYTTVRPYNMSLSVTDSAHTALHLQFAVATYATASATASVMGSTTNSPTSNNASVMGLYGLYLTVLAVFGILWIEAKHVARELAHAR